MGVIVKISFVKLSIVGSHFAPPMMGKHILITVAAVSQDIGTY